MDQKGNVNSDVAHRRMRQAPTHRTGQVKLRGKLCSICFYRSNWTPREVSHLHKVTQLVISWSSRARFVFSLMTICPVWSKEKRPDLIKCYAGLGKVYSSE